MNALPHPLASAFRDWLITPTLQASVLVLVVLTVQWMFQKQLRPRWRYALWWVVLLKLMLPWSPESSLSLFNWVKPASVRIATGQISVETSGSVHPVPTSSRPSHDALSAISDPSPATLAPLPYSPGESTVSTPSALQRVGVAVPSLESHRSDWDWISLLMVLWSMGVVLLGGVVLTRSIRFSIALRRNSNVVGLALIGQFERCRLKCGVGQAVELIETPLTQSPALFGLFRRKLLLPPGMPERFSPEELDYIFLHELAHLKRGDLWQNWLMTGLQILHWFNPMIWWAFARIRADREAACDDLALECSGASTGEGYGETVVKLLEQIHSPGSVPGGVGIMEDRTQIHRRLRMILDYRPHQGWSLFAIALLGLVGWVGLTDGQSPQARPVAPETTPASAVSQPTSRVAAGAVQRARLTGVVEVRDGEKLSTPATVFIAEASPKVGTSTLCPSCYVDCRKRATARADGNFTLEGLDPELNFELLVVAKGYQPKSLSRVDPARGAVRVILDPIESTDLSKDRILLGRVQDGAGNLIEGALIEMEMVWFVDGGGMGGAVSGVDPRAVSDENGDFLLSAKKPIESMTVMITGRGFAPRRFSRLSSGGIRHSLTVTEGATLKGRIVSKGLGLGGILVGVCGVDRSVQHFLGHFDVGTAEDGTFAFLNLPAEGEFYLYGLMRSMGDRGAIPLQQMRLGKDGTTTDLGVIEVLPAFRVSGRIESSDGSKLPPNTRVMIGRDLAWDVIQADPDAEGRFDVLGVPGETVSLSVKRRGWELSPHNLSLDLLNGGSLIGRVDGSNTNLVVRLQPASSGREIGSPSYQAYEATKKAPLRGSEISAQARPGWRISGRVLDQDTMQPIPDFRVRVGSLGPFGRSEWAASKTFQGSLGEYSLIVRQEVIQPALSIEADGYVVLEEIIQPRENAALDFKLRKGSGVKGRVLKSDGKPAGPIGLALICKGFNRVSIDRSGNLTPRPREELMVETEDDGSFEFQPRLDVSHLLVYARDGFALVSLEQLQREPIVRLEPFGRIQGKLRRGDQAVTNAELHLALAVSVDIRIDGLGQVDTDTEGRFAFDRVPGGRIQINLRDSESGGAPLLLLVPEIEVKPGLTSEVLLQAPLRSTNNFPNSEPSLPWPVRVPGVQLKGVVLSPTGTPVSGAEVAFQVPGRFLAVARGVFRDMHREIGLLDTTDQNGKFRLPMCEGLKSVVAVSMEGIAQVRLDEVLASSKIQLQPWGEIHGTFRLGNKPAVGRNLKLMNETFPPQLLVSAGRAISPSGSSELEPLGLDYAAFSAVTDSNGDFIFPFVPPGRGGLRVLQPTGPHGGSYRLLGNYTITSGQKLRLDVGGQDRPVTGKGFWGEGAAGNAFEKAEVTLRAGFSAQLLARWKAATNLQQDAELSALPESRQARLASRIYRGQIQADGSFAFEAVTPGDYELVFEVGSRFTNPGATHFVWAPTKPVRVPTGEPGSPVNLGNIVVEPVTPDMTPPPTTPKP